MSLTSLPNELILTIIKSLSPRDLSSFSQTSHRFHATLASTLHELLLADKDQILIWAAKKGNETIARLLLREGADVRAWDRYEMTALYVAVQNNQEDIVALLLQNGALIDDDRGQYLRTALHIAVENGSVAISELLLDHGAEINALASNGWTPLHFAAINERYSTTKLLIDRGCDPTIIRQKDGSRPLHYAVRNTNVKLVKLLVRCSGDINFLSRRQEAPLHWATRGACEEEIIRLLLDNGADVTLRDFNGMSPYLLAAAKSNISVVKLLLDYGASVDERDNAGSTALHHAASTCARYGGDAAIVGLLLSLGIDVNVRDSEKRTPLHSAADKAADNMIMELLKHGAEIDARDRMGMTPLHHTAAYTWLSEVTITSIKLLVDNGADVNAQDEEGMTPLHLVFHSMRRAMGPDSVDETTRFLLERGARVDIQNHQGLTALHYVAHYEGDEGLLFDLLVKHGADPLNRDNKGDTPLGIRGRSKGANDLF